MEIDELQNDPDNSMDVDMDYNIVEEDQHENYDIGIQDNDTSELDEDDLEDEDEEEEAEHEHDHDEEEDEEDDYHRHGEQEEDDDEDEEEDLLSERRFRSAHQLLSSLTGMVNRFSSRIRPILEAIEQREDLNEVMSGLQELADNLLMSNEDALSSYFPLDKFTEQLVNILQDPLFENNPEIMLMACRNISNMIEVMPSSASSVVAAGAVPLLCQKLLEIQYIDLAEQALSVSITLMLIIQVLY